MGNAAIQQLRIEKLKNGFPFMINYLELPTNICYLEYPDGSIKLMTFKRDARNFTLIRSCLKLKISRSGRNLV